MGEEEGAESAERKRIRGVEGKHGKLREGRLEREGQLAVCSCEGAKRGKRKRGSEGRRGKKRNRNQFPVIMARGRHLFPYRTQKLSLLAPMVLGWERPGRVGRRRIP